MPLPVYTGPFGPAQAERLLWRAGFGPRPGEERALAAKGLDGALGQLLATGKDRLVGRPPKVNGRRLYPVDKFGHDHLWWLDKMDASEGENRIGTPAFGMDTHDLMVKGTKVGAKTLRFKKLDPRGRTERTLRLTPGRYALWCSLGDHKARGMKATLVVRK